MNEKELAAYLDRIGTGRPGKADSAALRALHRAHLLAVPFENLSIHLGEPIILAEAELLAKMNEIGRASCRERVYDDV